MILSGESLKEHHILTISLEGFPFGQVYEVDTETKMVQRQARLILDHSEPGRYVSELRKRFPDEPDRGGPRVRPVRPELQELIWQWEREHFPVTCSYDHLEQKGVAEG